MCQKLKLLSAVIHGGFTGFIEAPDVGGINLSKRYTINGLKAEDNSLREGEPKATPLKCSVKPPPSNKTPPPLE